MLKGKILKSGLDSFVLRIKSDNKEELINYCKKHKIDFEDKSNYSF